MTKQCRTCGETKPVSDFYRNPATVRGGGHRADCKACTNTARKARYAATGGIEAHRQVLRTAYGLRPEDYAAQLNEQHGVCAVCRQPEVVTYKGRPRRLAVDHDRRTGRMRGLLCQRCNLLVGALEQEPALVEAAAAYLHDHTPKAPPAPS